MVLPNFQQLIVMQEETKEGKDVLDLTNLNSFLISILMTSKTLKFTGIVLL